MKEYQTVTQGRSRRSNAGNRMQELLEKARQEDQEKDELFAEEADDGEFEEPAAQRDVFLDEFADTDEDVDSDDDDEDSRLRREERAKKKGKGVFNPFVKIRSGAGPSVPQPSAAELASLDPSIDVSKMAPSTLVLELRKKRREAKRLHRSEARRSNLRASTLRTEQDVIEREKQEKIALKASRKGRKAQHETGEVRGARPMTQAELIAAALEEEERNKEALTQWLRREEEKRELRRVGRKVVRGPRLTFVSRTVGKLVEVVDESRTGTEGKPAEKPSETSGRRAEKLAKTAAGENDADVSQETDTEAQLPDKHKSATKMGIDDTTASTEKRAESATPAGPATPPVTTDTPARDLGASAADAKANAPEAGPSTTAEPPAACNSVPAVPEAQPSASQPESPQANERTEQPRTGPSNVATSTNAASTTTVPAAPAESKVDPSSSAGPSTQAGPSSHPPSAQTITITDNETAAPNGADTDLADASKSADTANGKDKGKATAAEPEPDADADPSDQAPSGPYERNYLILNQVPGGLASEVSLILGDHVDWSDVKVIPARNRPINRKPPTDPLTSQPARYRHPASNVPYASAESYATLQALLDNRYVWTEGGWWAGGEADAVADGVDGPDGIPGWREACMRGWGCGKRLAEVDVTGEGDDLEGEEGEDGMEVDGEEAGDAEEDEHEDEHEGDWDEDEVEEEGSKPVSRRGKNVPKGKKAAPKKAATSKATKRSGGTKRKAAGRAPAARKKARR